MTADEIAQFVKEKRKEQNISQVKLTSKVGVGPSTLVKWERGMHCPSLEIAILLLDCLGYELVIRPRKD